jgi:hypothetical protein
MLSRAINLARRDILMAGTRRSSWSIKRTTSAASAAAAAPLAPIAADAIFDSYTMFREDPFIVSNLGGIPIEFSAWNYARKRCTEIASG